MSPASSSIRSGSDALGDRAGGFEHPRLDQRDHASVAVRVEEGRDQAAADEAGKSGDEIGHRRGIMPGPPAAAPVRS